MRKKQQPGNQQKNTLTQRYQVLHPKLPDLAELTIIAERARREGFIAIQDISMILSSDVGYNELLPAMWEECQISIRRKFPDDISSPESRFGVWYALFERWTRGTVAAVSGGLRPINMLRAHSYDSVQSNHIVVDGTHNDPDYVMLKEVRSYFTDYLKIHLPLLLYHPDKEQGENMPVSVPDESKNLKGSQISTENHFHHEGTGWHIRFQGETGIFTDVKYIRYISLLLEKRGKPIGALELVHAVDDYTPEKKSIEQALDQGLSFGKNYRDDEISDKKVREYEKLLSDIEQETDPMVKRELEEEREKKEADLLKMNRLVDDDGRPAKQPKKQKIDDPHRKTAQKAVAKGLKNAYSAFNKCGMKKLVKHLKDKIKTTGNYDFCYVDNDTPWNLRL